MATPEDVRKLAQLSRLHVEDAELLTFTKEFDSILAYVSQLEELKLAKTDDEKPPLRNVMREDGEPHTPGKYTEKLVAQFPSHDGDALSVKKIISHD